MKIEIDLPACGHPEQVKELQKLKSKLIEMTAWAGWLDDRWVLEILFWVYPDYPSVTVQRNFDYTFSGAREICLKLAAADLGFKKFEEIEILYRKTKEFREALNKEK